MTTDSLIVKYSKIFQDYVGNPGRVNWYGVPDGWLLIIDKLCGAIQDYIDNVSISEDNPEYIKGSKWDENDTSTQKYIAKHHPQVTCYQMKEKFASLRFYTNGNDDIVEGMIRFAQYLSENTCEQCGSEENIGITKGWLTVLCQSCSEKQDRIWELNK